VSSFRHIDCLYFSSNARRRDKGRGDPSEYFCFIDYVIFPVSSLSNIAHPHLRVASRRPAQPSRGPWPITVRGKAPALDMAECGRPSLQYARKNGRKRDNFRLPDVVEFAMSPQVGQAVLAFARSHSSSDPKFSAGGQARTACPTCEAFAIERNGSAHFPRQAEIAG
jgi:hypothetical protein